MAKTNSFQVGFTNEIREEVYNFQNGICKNCLSAIVEFHHMLHNTKVNHSLFPLFVNSIFNCCGLCRNCHEKFPHLYKITTQQAAAYEWYLKVLKET